MVRVLCVHVVDCGLRRSGSRTHHQPSVSIFFWRRRVEGAPAAAKCDRLRVHGRAAENAEDRARVCAARDGGGAGRAPGATLGPARGPGAHAYKGARRSHLVGPERLDRALVLRDAALW
eukprot:scaffold3720_cov401-Prasinococcus_capsulatus_cf.AAC.8